MSTAIFDLGARLRAAQTGQVQPRLHHTPLVPAAPLVALDVTADGTVTVQFAGQAPQTGTGPAGLAPLVALVPRETTDVDRPMHTVAVAERAVLRRAKNLAAKVPVSDPALLQVGALLSWWSERLDHPDTQAAVVVPSACRARWVTGEHPDRERRMDTWLDWLDVDATGTAAVVAVMALLRDGTPLPGMVDKAGKINGDDRWAWSQLGRAVGKDRNWNVGDSQRRQVLGLLTRSSSAEVRERQLLNDPAWQARGRWDGTAVRGTVTHVGVTAKVRSAQTDCKLKPGRPLQLVGFRRDAEGRTLGLKVVAEAIEVDAASGEVTMVVRALNRSKAGLLAMFVVGDDALLLPDEVTAAQQIRKRQTVETNLSRPHWTRQGAGKASRTSRDVPLDVIAAAHG